MNLNKGISTPIAILFIVIVSAVVGVLVWQFKPAPEAGPELTKPQATTSEEEPTTEQPSDYTAQSTCEEAGYYWYNDACHEKATWECGNDVTFTYQGKEVTYGTVSYDGECWMDRNLGADSVAKAVDNNSAYGDLFQWGRCDDGHQDRESATYKGPVSTSACNAGNSWDGQFVTVDTSPYNWVDSQNDNLWQEDGTGINNPCPEGWRIPTKSEWKSASNDWDDKLDALNSSLKLPSAGFRFYQNNDSRNEAGSSGQYWTSTVDNIRAWRLRLFPASFGGGVYMDSAVRGNGFSVRCLKDLN